jgi:hypothetical protein
VIHWFMTAPMLVIFAAGLVIGVPLWLLIFAWLDRPLPPYVSPYAHAQREYEQARDAYQRALSERLNGEAEQ